VLCMLAAMAALAAPALDRPFANQRLVKTADLIRAEWARLRVEAIESGCIRVFRCSIGTDQYRLESLNIDGSDTSISPAERTLPKGVVFGGLSIGGLAAGATEGGWTEPVLFYPDGTSSNAVATLANRVDRTIEVNLRGLTGVAIVGVIHSAGGSP